MPLNDAQEKELDIIGLGNELFDISIFSRLPQIIQFRVIRDGKILICKDKNFLNRTKVEVFRKYLAYSVFINSFYKRIIQNV